MGKKEGKVKITWFGHSAFHFESPSGKSVLIDPWLDNPKAPVGVKETVKADLILVTHGHGDHLGNTIELAQRLGVKVIAIHELAIYLQSQGVSNAIGMNKGGTIVIDGLKATMVQAFHSSDIDVGGKVTPGGEAAGFILELDNKYRIYHSGDTTVFGDMKYIAQLYKPDIAILPIDGYYNMGPREAALAFTFIKPKHIIGMHYGTFPILAGTPALLKNFLPSSLKGRVRELEPGITASFS
jgi:L-ascorbate metabolism protein UlaG (beta-lactamase superfamily)